MPVPIMFAITMHVAVSKEMRCGVEGTDIDLKFKCIGGSSSPLFDVKSMATKPHLLLASVRVTLANDEAPRAFPSRRPIDLTLVIVSPFCHLSPHRFAKG